MIYQGSAELKIRVEKNGPRPKKGQAHEASLRGLEVPPQERWLQKQAERRQGLEMKYTTKKQLGGATM